MNFNVTFVSHLECNSEFINYFEDPTISMSFNFNSITLLGSEYVLPNGTLRLNLTSMIFSCDGNNFGFSIIKGEGMLAQMMKRSYDTMKPYLAKNVNRFYNDYYYYFQTAID